MTDVSNTQDILDSRDIIKRIEELEGECDDLYGDGWDDDTLPVEEDVGELDELRALIAFQDECEGSPDWIHGEAVIRDTYFEDYARQLAEDIGAISGQEGWPLNCIDWEYAASELQTDYMSAEYDGVEYWIRA